MAMNERMVNGVMVIELSGKFLNDPQVSDFVDRFSDLKESGAYKVVTDLGGVNYISSAGVGTLVGGAKSLREDSGDLRLANLSERTEDVLVLICRLAAIHVFDTVDEAVNSF